MFERKWKLIVTSPDDDIDVFYAYSWWGINRIAARVAHDAESIFILRKEEGVWVFQDGYVRESDD